MATTVTDAETFKDFIRARTMETWETRNTPYYLSYVATDLKKQEFDYREVVGPLKLSQWAVSNEIPDIKLVSHPTQKAKVGFVPQNSGFAFESNEPLEERPARKSTGSTGRSLINFVQNLSDLPDSALSDFNIPARTLIALLKN